MPISLAIRLKDKTKGTRSRVITRALTAYLDEKEAFNITDIDSRTLMAVLHARPEVSETLKMALMMELNK